jgi:UDP-N-acetylglucosamine 2-epimerase (non-hydrolysing)
MLEQKHVGGKYVHSSALEGPRVKVAIIFGTRPEAIKLAPVVKAFDSEAWADCTVCVTGQHRQMLDQVLEVFGIRPKHDLNVMKADQTLPLLTSRLMTALGDYFERTKPSLVLVQGDTTTAVCAALTAFYYHVPVGHVEAGLRTNNLLAPWPEEANRQMLSRLATLHFAPTLEARQNLLNENVDESRILVTGNTVVDALLHVQRHLDTVPDSTPTASWQSKQAGSRIVLITGHRRENFGPGFLAICRAIRTLAGRFPDVDFVYPVHLNPNVRTPVMSILQGSENRASNVHLIEPLNYLEFVALMRRATLVLTDSGGIQEEAPTFKIPVLIMREVTERSEAIEAGTARLVGSDEARIVAEVTQLLTDDSMVLTMVTARNPFGDGRAAERIARACRNFVDGTRPLLADQFGGPLLPDARLMPHVSS